MGPATIPPGRHPTGVMRRPAPCGTIDRPTGIDLGVDGRDHTLHTDI